MNHHVKCKVFRYRYLFRGYYTTIYRLYLCVTYISYYQIDISQYKVLQFVLL